jgi:hypothetical protein
MRNSPTTEGFLEVPNVQPRYRLLFCLSLVFGSGLWCWNLPQAQAYVEAPMSFGAIVAQSTHIMLMRVESVDKEKNLIIYRKVVDIKGKHPQEVIKHNIGRGGLRPNEWKPQMDWAEPGRMAVFFHNGGASETCIGNWWYQAYGGGEWWNHSHAEPFLLRSYCGPPEKLVGIVGLMLAGQEAVASCMVDGNKEDLHNRRAKIQRLKVSLKIQDYNPKRDFVGWGGEDFRRINGMAGFTHFSALNRIEEPQAISIVDYNADGKPDVCLVGAGKVVILQNGGEAMSEVPLPLSTGARAAVWADYNTDGKPDLLLATVSGPKLFTNLGDKFRDDSNLLPQEPFYNLTAAAWVDYDSDGKPDLLLANGYHGLRLYRNIGVEKPPVAAGPKFGKWQYLGPFDNTGGKGFNTSHPVEKEVDLQAAYDGKGGERISWKEEDFPDGAINNLLRLFPNPKHQLHSAVYLYREVDAPHKMDFPISLGSDDTLSVWLNGKKIVANNVQRACAPDQDQAVLKLLPGKNHLLLKICNGEGDWAFYMAQGKVEAPLPKGPAFADVSAEVGLGPNGLAGAVKGDSLTVCDVNGDGRPDILYGAGTGVLLLASKNAEGKPIYVEAKETGLNFLPGKVGPVFGDFDNDGFPDLFVPQKGTSKLFKNDGKGKFTDVTTKAGDLAQNKGWVSSAAWGDFDNDGQLDLLVGSLKSPNRLFRNRGDGTFEEATDKIGLEQKIFNSQAVGLVDLNNDGMLDMVFNNEGQDSCVLLGNPTQGGKRISLTMNVGGKEGVVGSRVWVTDKKGQLQATQQILGGEGRGGQPGLLARFTLEPGPYLVHVRYSTGLTRMREISVGTDPVRGMIDEQTPTME